MHYTTICILSWAIKCYPGNRPHAMPTSIDQPSELRLFILKHLKRAIGGMQRKQPKMRKKERERKRENTIEDLVKAHFINLLLRPKTQTQPETTASYWENVRRSLLGLECNFFRPGRQTCSSLRLWKVPLAVAYGSQLQSLNCSQFPNQAATICNAASAIISQGRGRNEGKP